MISHQNVRTMIYSRRVAHWLLGGLGRHLEEVGKINESETGVPLLSKVSHCLMAVMVRRSFIHSAWHWMAKQAKSLTVSFRSWMLLVHETNKADGFTIQKCKQRHTSPTSAIGLLSIERKCEASHQWGRPRRGGLTDLFSKVTDDIRSMTDRKESRTSIGCISTRFGE